MQAENTIEPTRTGDSDIYVVAAHPHWQSSRVNRQLRDRAKQLPRTQICDLYNSYPDFHIDRAREQQCLAAAQLVVFLHPIHWYAMPALMKLWVDEVLSFGWAYGGGQALAGKDLWLVATTGGSEQAYHPSGYNRYFFDAFLPPYEQTAALCGMRFLPPLVLHGAHSISEAEVEQHVDVFAQRLQSYPEWPELADMEMCPGCVVPMADRPIAPEAATAARGDH